MADSNFVNQDWPGTLTPFGPSKRQMFLIGGYPATVAMMVLIALGGCSSPVALSQANHTAKLMSQLQVQLDQFHDAMDAAQGARLSSMAEQRRFLERDEMSARFNAIALRSAGDTQRIAMSDKLLSAADFVGAMEPTLAQQSKADDERFASLLTPSPSTTDDMNAAQVAASKMGIKQSFEDRVKELVAAAKDVRNGVKQDLVQLEAAKKSASDAANKTKSVVDSQASAASAAFKE